jgi:glycerophosphoryl diester phosphodiesterase
MKKLIFAIVVLIGFTSCKKKALNIQNLNNNEITALGHAGMGIGNVLPMNSFESISRAINMGADGVEVDVQFSLDEEFVAFHDSYLDNNSNKEGQIYQMLWKDIAKASYRNPVLSN